MSLVGLIILMPVFVVMAVLIGITMGGPVFFSQTRIGRYGRPFRIIKFRTMQVDEDELVITIKNDRRITSTGAFLRRYRLDELPQLWNVLTGEMSLVGPRPDVPGYADKLTGDDRQILKLRPGIHVSTQFLVGYKNHSIYDYWQKTERGVGTIDFFFSSLFKNN